VARHEFGARTRKRFSRLRSKRAQGEYKGADVGFGMVGLGEDDDCAGLVTIAETGRSLRARMWSRR
jgi:hypothetical protein